MNQLFEIMKDAKRAVFFGGAGVSTESGIPDFRSETGLYNAIREYNAPPEEIISASFFRARPEVFFDFYLHHMIYPDARPNGAHMALAEWEAAGRLAWVVTQNIDGLHQMAGSKNVLELHGSVHRNHCMDCLGTYSLGYVLNRQQLGESVPRCEACGGIVRPDVVLYEEGLPDDVIRKSVEAISKADVLIVGGTSLSVYPAAGLVDYFHGHALVLINQSGTSMDQKADLVIRRPIGEVLDEVRKMLGTDQNVV